MRYSLSRQHLRLLHHLSLLPANRWSVLFPITSSWACGSKNNWGGTEKPSFEIFKDEDTKIRLFDFNEDHQSRSLIQLDSNGYYKEVFIAIYDLKKLDRYLLELYNLGYRDYTYMEYRNSVYQRTKAKARDEAIENAKEKAGQLAASLNISLGKAYQVEELGSEDHNWYNIRNKDAAATLTHRLGSGKYLVEPGYITITSRVRVSFLIL